MTVENLPVLTVFQLNMVAYAALAMAFLGVVLALRGQQPGLWLTALDLSALAVFQALLPAGYWRPAELLSSGVGLALLWTGGFLLVGFGIEPFAARIGVRLFRIDRGVLMGAALGLLLTLFLPFGLTTIVGSAYLGASIASMLMGSRFKRALGDGVGALLAIFGPKGIRLMCTLSLASLLVQSAT
ncbi:MAG: hypothetical protein HY692_02620 [Cyanobacteria bacterium NC_groundwater_1444_Ag_S-0.65um_54_12]|nr:hypothetical protein [Cyanobacteria bacterium NC_groundwater_1444_Ag_S-0.65um_54_12]